MKCHVVVARRPLTFCGGDKKRWQLVCLDHWNQLPKPLQDEVWRQYKAAQGSPAHLAAIHECYRFLSAPVYQQVPPTATRAATEGQDDD